jgi:hypothetical protein
LVKKLVVDPLPYSLKDILRKALQSLESLEKLAKACKSLQKLAKAWKSLEKLYNCFCSPNVFRLTNST